MVEYNFRPVPIFYLVKTICLSKNGIPKANYSIIVPGTYTYGRHKQVVNKTFVITYALRGVCNPPANTLLP